MKNISLVGKANRKIKGCVIKGCLSSICDSGRKEVRELPGMQGNALTPFSKFLENRC